jgi:hypothetical protein
MGIGILGHVSNAVGVGIWQGRVVAHRSAVESGRPGVKAILVSRSLHAGIDTTQILIRTDDTRLRVDGGRCVAPLGDELRGALSDAFTTPIWDHRVGQRAA